MPPKRSYPERPSLSPGSVKEHIRHKSRKRRESQKTRAVIEQHAGVPRNDLAPDFRLLRIDPAQLKSADRRVRKADRVQIDRIKASICTFGICAPLVIDEQNRIVHGHLVWEAAKELGIPDVPVVVLTHLDPVERRKLALTLNRIGETGVWDIPVLEVEMTELVELGEDLVVTGFDAAEIDGLTVLVEEDDAADDVVPPVPVRPVSRAGDCWCLGGHRLVQGDCRSPANWALVMGPQERARLVLTDQPYNVPNVGHVTSREGVREFAMAAGEMSREEFAGFTREWIVAALPHLVDGGLLATFIDWRSVEIVLAAGREAGLALLNVVVWAKNNAGQGSLWRSRHELLPVFRSGTAQHVNNVALGKHGRWRSNVWEYAGASSLGSEARAELGGHPTPKPCAMLEDALLDVTRRDDLVIDPFAGSGSTLMAAEATGRRCRAIEIDGGYCDVIIRRWQAATGDEARLEATGQTFAEVEAERMSGEDR